MSQAGKKIREVLGDKSAKELEKSLTEHLDTLLESISMGKELKDRAQEAYQKNEQSANPVFTHLNCLTNENLPALKKAFDEKDPNLGLYKDVFVDYLKKVARPYGYTDSELAPPKFLSFGDIQSAVNKLSNIVLNQSSYAESTLASGFGCSIADFRALQSKNQGEYSMTKETGTVQSWLESKRDLAWQKDAPKEAKQDLIMAAATVQKDLFNYSFKMSGATLASKTNSARHFVENLPLLASDKNPQGLSPEVFTELGLVSGKLISDYEDAKEFDYYGQSSRFDRNDLGMFIAIGQEYLKKTGAKELPKELQLSRITPKTLSQPKALYDSMKRYVGVIENGQPLTTFLSKSSLKGARIQEEGVSKRSTKPQFKAPITPQQVQH